MVETTPAPCGKCDELRQAWNATRSGTHGAFAAMAAFDDHMEAVHGIIRKRVN